jgi:RHS repeat-associated protein
MLTDGTYTYIWNARNQLTQLKQGSTVVATYAYDALGRRITKATTATTSYAYNEGNFVQERNGSGTPTANLLTGGTDDTFSRTDPTGTRDLLTDALGSTVALVDPAGTVQTSYTYEPFGKTTVTGQANGNSQQFTGRENDGPLYFYRARYLHPTFGRFISEDPAGFLAGDPNIYRYVGDSPTNATDPSGMVWWFVAGCGAGVAAYALFTIGGNILGGRDDWTKGWDWVDAGISCAAGAIGGLMGGEGWGALDKAVIGAVTGFDAELASQVHHGEADPLGLVLSTAGGGAFSAIPIPGPQDTVKVPGGGFAINVGVGIGQSGLQDWLHDFLEDTVLDWNWWTRPLF